MKKTLIVSLLILSAIGSFAQSQQSTAKNNATRSKGCEVSRKNGEINVQSHRTYLGYYPNLYKLYPDVPDNAVPAWPTIPYTQVKDPPCYTYTRKSGLKMMECPGARFEPGNN